MEFYEYLAVMVGWLFGGISSGSTSMGAALIALPISLLALSPEKAVLVTSFVCLFSATHLIYSYRKYAKWSDMSMLIYGCIPGCFLGILILQAAPARFLQLLISLMLFCFLVLQCFPISHSWKLSDNRSIGFFFGILCGIASTAVSVVGAPLGIYVLLRRWDSNRSRGNISLMGFMVGVATVVFQAGSGLYDWSIITLGLCGGVTCTLSQVLGVWLGRNLGITLFRRLLIFFITISAVTLFYRAIVG